MKPMTVTMIVLLVLSLAAGLAIGEVFFRLFVGIVPPAVLSQFNAQAAHVAHLAYGAGAGVVLFVWALLGMAAGRMSKPGSKPAAGS
ncbi:MAG: hypothetical protein ACHQ52_09850 [Candidatus Eisenbacteria bacterium]